MPGTRCSPATCSSARREDELEGFTPDFTILHAPEYEADPADDGCRTSTCIALSFAAKTILIAGTSYAGEIKKSIFTVMNWLLPDRGRAADALLAPMSARTATPRCSSACPAPARPRCRSDPERSLIGDDEHGWSDTGVFNFEGGCYAKVIRLIARGRAADLGRLPPLRRGAGERGGRRATAGSTSTTASLTENTRSCYPMEFIPNTVAGRAGAGCRRTW